MGVWKSKDTRLLRPHESAREAGTSSIDRTRSFPSESCLAQEVGPRTCARRTLGPSLYSWSSTAFCPKAEALLRDVPLVTDMSQIPIERMAAYLYAWMLEEDEEIRRHGTGSEELFQDIAQQLCDAGIPFLTPFATTGKKRPFGLSDRELLKIREDTDGVLALAKEALARGDISFCPGTGGRAGPSSGSIWTHPALPIGNSATWC